VAAISVLHKYYGIIALPFPEICRLDSTLSLVNHQSILVASSTRVTG
jgi:hypothetical protein